MIALNVEALAAVGDGPHENRLPGPIVIMRVALGGRPARQFAGKETKSNTAVVNWLIRSFLCRATLRAIESALR